MGIFDKVRARLSFSPRYCRAVAENTVKSSAFMYHKAMSIFLASNNVLNLAFFGLSINILCLSPVTYQWKFPLVEMKTANCKRFFFEFLIQVR